MQIFDEGMKDLMGEIGDQDPSTSFLSGGAGSGNNPFQNPANGMNFTLGNFYDKQYPPNMKIKYETMPTSFTPQ